MCQDETDKTELSLKRLTSLIGQWSRIARYNKCLFVKNNTKPSAKYSHELATEGTLKNLFIHLIGKTFDRLHLEVKIEID